MNLARTGSPINRDRRAAAGAAQCIQTPLSVMNCPSRRPSVLFGTEYAGMNGNVTFYGANTVAMVARADYAACAGDQYYGWTYLSGPATLADAALYTKNFPNGDPTWPNLGKDPDKATGISYLRSEVAMAWVTDGTSNTYMVGEKYLNADGTSMAWTAPTTSRCTAAMTTTVTARRIAPTPLPANYVPTHTPMQDTRCYTQVRGSFWASGPKSCQQVAKSYMR